MARSCLLATIAPFPHGSKCAAFSSLLNSVWCLPPFANIIIIIWVLCWKTETLVQKGFLCCKMSRETPLNHLNTNRLAYFLLHILLSIFFFFFPSLRSPAKSFPWWWRVVFASSVDTVSSLSLSFSCQKHYCWVSLTELYLTKWTKCSAPLHLFFYHRVYTDFYLFFCFCCFRGFILNKSQLKQNKIKLFLLHI